MSINTIGEGFILSYLEIKDGEYEYKTEQQALLTQQLLTYNITKENINKLATVKKSILNWNCQYCFSKNSSLTNCKNCGAPNLEKC